MISVCAWHQPKPIVIGEKEPLDDKRETHVMCNDCAAAINAELDRIENRSKIHRRKQMKKRIVSILMSAKFRWVACGKKPLYMVD